MVPKRDDTESWVNIAASAAERVNYVAHGEKKAAYEEIGKDHDLSPNHIRRMVRALTFTVELRPKHPKLADALRFKSFKAAEIIDRWHDKDPAAAIAAANRYVSGNLTLRLLSAEANGESSAAEPIHIDKTTLDWASFREAAWLKMQATIGCELVPADHPEPLDHLSAIDRIVSDRSGQIRWALILVEPGLALSKYLARRELDLGRALALKRLNIIPVFAIPPEAGPADFRQVLEAFGQSTVILLEIGIIAAYR